VVLLLAIKYVLKAKNFKNIILFVFVILVVFASIVSFPQSKRVLSLLSIQDLYGDDSFLIRVVQGIATYNSLPIEKKFTGFGFRNTGKALNYYKGSFYNLFSISEEAGNALFYDFLSMGFLLSVFYQIYLFKIFVRKKSGIVIFIAFEIIRLGTDMSLISSEFLLMILLIISQNDLNNKCESTLRLSHRNKTKKAISSMVIDIE
jgi:hypothetical protein